MRDGTVEHFPESKVGVFVVVVLCDGRHRIAVDVGAGGGPQAVLADVEHGAAVRQALAPHPQVPQVHGAECRVGQGARVQVMLSLEILLSAAVVEWVR